MALQYREDVQAGFSLGRWEVVYASPSGLCGTEAKTITNGPTLAGGKLTGAAPAMPQAPCKSEPEMWLTAIFKKILCHSSDLLVQLSDHVSGIPQDIP